MKMQQPTAGTEKRTGVNRSVDDAVAGPDANQGPVRRARRTRGERCARRLARMRAGAIQPEQVDTVEDAKRMILTHLRVPLACEEKACRRALRCVGTIRSVAGQPLIAYWERHRDVLQPFFCQHVLPVLNAARVKGELEDEF